MHNNESTHGERIVRASFDNDTIVVYQAFNRSIAEAVVQAQTFVAPPFKMERMTWIKPSFLWMMYRSGWATKENQECILSIRIKRDGFEWALNNSCLSHFDPKVHAHYEEWRTALAASPVRIQWDPEKDIHLQNVSYRSIQIGLSGIAVEKYVSDWIVQVTDITQECKRIHQQIRDGQITDATNRLPIERAYPLPDSIALAIHSA